MKVAWIFIFFLISLVAFAEPVPETLFETSGGKKTPGYDETMTWFRNLAGQSDVLQMTTFGTSPEGRLLPLIIADLDHRFSPSQHATRQDEVVLLVQACIHAGESCGKDAGMLLMRELATNPEVARKLLDKVTLLFIPIFNTDGHERFGPYNRINQNGPDEMGWRVNSRNQNLNRDFLKADTPEMRFWLKLYQEWLPDFFIDIHSTDGADYQYAITFGLETHGNMDAELSSWTSIYRDAMISGMSDVNFPMAPYVSFKEWHDPRSGLATWVAGPRFSQGYTALQNRPGLLIETHMLKDYPTRVQAARQLVRQTMEYLNSEASALREKVLQADDFAASKVFRREPYALTLKLTDNHRPFTFLGVSYEKVTSEITGGDWFRFSDTPEAMEVELYDELVPNVIAQLPEAYIVPPQWTEIIDRLNWHGIKYQVLTEKTELEVRSWRFSGAKWRENPYEGHHPVSFEQEMVTETRNFPAGSAVVDMNQRSARVIAHLLEPQGPDSLIRWGYLDAIFERVEYVESYVIEDMIREMVADDPNLLVELEKRKIEDPEFASDPWAIRYWFYEKTPYYDQKVGVYPVGLLDDAGSISELPLIGGG
ncbi:MAG: M14 family metallopeptidase [bacterium]|nr:M14 family metallopeptidase [bacterium]